MEVEDEEMWRVNLAANKFAESLSCIVFIDTGKWLHAVGSGSLIKICGKYFVATAAHIIKGCNPQNIRIGSPLIEHHYFKIVALNLLGGGDDDKEDLAWIEIEIPSQFEIENIVTEKNPYLQPLTIEDPILVSGYPNKDVNYVEKDGLYTTSSGHFGYITGVVYDKDWDHSFDKSYHILLEYNRTMRIGAGKTEDSPPAWGLSGGGIWMNDRPQKTLRLAGIQTSWDGPNEQLHGIKIAYWIEFLKSSRNDII